MALIKNSLKIPEEKVAKLRKYADEMLETDKEKIQKLTKLINLSLLKKMISNIIHSRKRGGLQYLYC